MRLRWIAPVAVCAALAGCTSSGSGTPEPPSSSTSTPHTPTSTPRTATSTPPPAVSDMAGVFIAALGGGSGGEPQGARTYIRDHTVCSQMLHVNPCPPAPIPQPVQDQVIAALGPSVGFTAHPPVRLIPGSKSVVTLGAPHIAGNRATVTVETNCGPLCGLGETLVLARSGDGWVRTGTTGSSWIS